MKIKKYVLLLISLHLLLFQFSYSQEPIKIEQLNVYSFEILSDQDTIQFINANQDLHTKKPTIIFCQGSLPIPLIIDDLQYNEKFMPVFGNFDHKTISQRYNLVCISMPHTPLIASTDNLNNQYAYVTDRNNNYSYSPAYLNSNYMETYVRRGNIVINYLMKQPWVDNKNIFIVGHSQGAKVATILASQNKNIAALGFLSGNPLGRIDLFIREYRLQETKGILSKEEAQAKINKVYEWWQSLHDNIDKPSINGEDSPKTTISFSKPVLHELLNLQIPVFIGYGTQDIGASYCDLLPIDFIRVNKTNFRHVPYPGLEHNFMEVDEQGKRIPEKGHWNKVMFDFTGWLDSIKN